MHTIWEANIILIKEIASFTLNTNPPSPVETTLVGPGYQDLGQSTLEFYSVKHQFKKKSPTKDQYMQLFFFIVLMRIKYKKENPVRRRNQAHSLTNPVRKRQE